MVLAVLILGTVITTKILGTVLSSTHTLTHLLLQGWYGYPDFTIKKIESPHNLMEVTVKQYYIGNYIQEVCFNSIIFLSQHYHYIILCIMRIF